MAPTKSKRSQKQGRIKSPVEDVISPAFIAAYNSLPREGPRRLEWAVKLVEQKASLPKIAGDERQKIVDQIYALIASLGRALAGGSEGTELYRRTRPAERWPEAVLKRWDVMIRSALNREKILVIDQKAGLIWWPSKNRFIDWVEHEGFDYLGDAAALAMRDLLLRHGHLLKQCPAPALKGKRGEKCETVFVASRPNKNYCSTQCQTRATTTSARERATLIMALRTPAVRKQIPGDGRVAGKLIRTLGQSRGKSVSQFIDEQDEEVKAFLKNLKL
jgi:hypothetical protein